MKRLLLAVVLLVLPMLCFPKENTDSLKLVLQKNNNDSIKAEALFLLSKAYRNINPDTALHYARWSFELGKKHFPSSITNKGYLSLGIMQEIIKNYDSSVYFLEKAIEFSEKYKDPKTLASAYNSLGVVSNKMGKTQMAIDNYIKALKQHELNKDERGMALAYNNLGVMYKKQKQYEKAIEHYQSAWKLYEKNHEPNTLVLTNIAGVYYMMKKYKDAEHFLLMAKKIDQENNDVESIMRILNNLTSCYLEDNNLNEGLKSNQEAIALSEHYKNYEEMINAYENRGVILTQQNDATGAAIFFNKALANALQINATPRVIELYKSLSESYNGSKQFELAAKYALKYAATKDSLMDKKNEQQIAEMQAKYETAQKDKELLLKNTELTKEQAASKQKSLERNAFIIAFILMLTLAFFIFKNYREKKKANIEISIQKEIIEQKQIEILDSIHYAKKIQESLLPTEKYIEKNLNRLRKKS